MSILQLSGCSPNDQADEQIEQFDRSIMIIVPSNGPIETADLARQYDQIMTERLGALTKWIVRTEPASANAYLDERTLNDKYKSLGVEFYVRSFVSINERSLHVTVRLSKFPAGSKWTKQYVGKSSDLQVIAEDVAGNLASWLGNH